MSTFPSALLDNVQRLSKIPQTSVSLKEMVQFGRIPTQQVVFRGCQFLSKELPIRLAHRVTQLENLPHDLSKMPSIINVKNWYTKSTQDLLEFQNCLKSFPVPPELKYYNNIQSDLNLGILNLLL
jgi:pyruvate dehydrogenase kinase 2/3/4